MHLTRSNHARRSAPLQCAVVAFASALLASTGIATSAQAQSVALNRYVPAETVYDGFALSRPNDLGHGRIGVVLHLDYANDPLVLELQQGDSDSETAAVVSDQLAAHAGFAVGLWERLVLSAGFDVNLLMKGDTHTDPVGGQTTETADGTGLGDGRLGARVRLLGENEDIAGLALQLGLTLPLGDVKGGQRYSSDGSVTFVPELVFEVRPGPVRITANLGTRVRKDADLGTGDVIEDELLYGLGATISVADDKLDLIVEGTGTTSLANFGDREGSPIELLGGGKYWVADGTALGLAASTGLQRGVGSPDFRIIAMFGWAMSEEEPEPEPEPEPPPPPKVGDRDQDGLLDNIDKCPDEPEDRDDFEDEDGCPDPDNDEDGILDDDDQCKNEPEDMDEFADEDGCPDPDNDQDGVLDVDDKCPVVPGAVEEQGCPKHVRVEEGQIIILERVEFATNKDIILDSSGPVLSEVRDVLAANPKLKLVRVEGHTDDRGKDAYNLDLSKRRSRSVARWLEDHGIDANRLEAYGCGETNPIADNGTRDGRQTNRRVEFHIIEPKPSTGVRSTAGCEPHGM
jgi:outer membrane protein OmpA-like peptidoglycan-associated protein